VFCQLLACPLLSPILLPLISPKSKTLLRAISKPVIKETERALSRKEQALGCKDL
jgi:hypothetical protein